MGTATPEDILSWVAAHPCLAAMIQDPVRAMEWAQDVAGARAGVRASDLREAIEGFVTKNGAAARKMTRDELAKSLGGYLAMARSYGDIDRAKQAKATSSRGGVPRPADFERPGAAKTRLSPDWKPSDAELAKIEARGFSREEALAALPEFLREHRHRESSEWGVLLGDFLRAKKSRQEAQAHEEARYGAEGAYGR